MRFNHVCDINISRLAPLPAARRHVNGETAEISNHRFNRFLLAPARNFSLFNRRAQTQFAQTSLKSGARFAFCITQRELLLHLAFDVTFTVTPRNACHYDGAASAFTLETHHNDDRDGTLV